MSSSQPTESTPCGSQKTWHPFGIHLVAGTIGCWSPQSCSKNPAVKTNTWIILNYGWWMFIPPMNIHDIWRWLMETNMDTVYCISRGSKHPLTIQESSTMVLGPSTFIWLVVSTPLKNMSQWEGLSHILWQIKKNPKHQASPTSYWCFLPLETPLKIWKIILPPRPRGRWKNSAFRLFRLPHRGTGTPLARTPLDTWPGTRCGRCSEKLCSELSHLYMENKQQYNI